MKTTLIGFVGDVLVNRSEPSEVFRDVREVLAAPQALFANLEAAYTDDPQPAPGVIGGGGAPLRYLDAFSDAGFDVMSLANNHILDVGYAAMLETRARLRSLGIKTCGAGETLSDARAPAMVDVDGMRIAYLAYASVFPVGFEARTNTPGLAPMRAYNFWRDPYPNIHVPGKQPLVTTVPDETDLDNLTDDIRKAKQSADLVVTSFHWGEYTRPYFLTDHEIRTARHCIDHGADIGVGHHHHALRGMEWYKEKPIMYGLGHFVFDLRLEWSDAFKKDLSELLSKSFTENPYSTAPREGWPYLPMHEDTRMTVLSWVNVDKNKIVSFGVLPCVLTPDGLVHPLEVGSAQADRVIEYLGTCNETQGLNGAFVTDGAPKLSGFATLRVAPLNT